MARSKRAMVVVGAALTFSALACNSLLGISDYDRGECSGGGICVDDGGQSTDAPTDTEKRDAPPVGDAAGSAPVSWAHFVMPNYAQDGGPDANLHAYEPSNGIYVEDKVSKRIWREPMTQTGPKSWADAKAICAALGDGKWRVPSRIELVTLLDLSRAEKIDVAFATNEKAEYWTVSEVRLPDGAVTTEHWTVDFDKGGVQKRSITDGEARVRCIKDQ